MNIEKIKKFLENKPRWLVILVTIICILLLGVSAWFGLYSCASIGIDKLNVNTDKVQVDVEGVKVQPKDVSLVTSRDDVYELCNYIESTCLGMSDIEKSDFLDSVGLNSTTYLVLLNSYGLVIINNHCYRVEELS